MKKILLTIAFLSVACQNNGPRAERHLAAMNVIANCKDMGNGTVLCVGGGQMYRCIAKRNTVECALSIYEQAPRK